MMNLRQFFLTQAWWGKLIGAFLGFLIAGPVGALVGILIGNFFDKGLTEHFTNPFWPYHIETNQDIKAVFIEAVFSILGHVSKSDGRVSEEEIRLAKMLMHELRLNSKQKKEAIHNFNQGKKTNFNLVEMLIKLRMITRDNPELLRIFIDVQYRAAQIDGLTENKIQSLNVILKSLGFAPLYDQYRFYEDFFQYRPHYGNESRGYQSGNRYYHSQRKQQASESTLAQAYALLETSPASSEKEVKRAYRKMISRHHPDKLIAQGLSAEMIKKANEKTQKIQKAYEQICKSKGWK